MQSAEFRGFADYIVPILNIVGAIHELPVLELRINYCKINLNSWLHLSGELSFAKQKDWGVVISLNFPVSLLPSFSSKMPPSSSEEGNA